MIHSSHDGPRAISVSLTCWWLLQFYCDENTSQGL